MSKRRDEEIRKVTARLSALLDELDAAIEALPQEIRDVLTGPGGDPAETEATKEGEPLR